LGKFCWLANGMALVLSWCRAEGMIVFFLKVQNTQCVYHHHLSSLMVLKMRRLRLEDSSRDREPLRLTPHWPEGDQGNSHWWDRCGSMSHPPGVKLRNWWTWRWW
jgi:hypothetical protein